MSCQIKSIAQLTDTDAIRRCLFPTDDLRGTDSWLQNSLISVSPTGELIVFARERKLVVLSAKWDSVSTKANFHISHTDSLDVNDPITAIACVPIAASGKSSEVNPDWTCIIVGFLSGFVKFYTENCTLLASEQFHNERVVNLKCQSLRRAKYDRGFDNFPEEIHVIYPTNICLVNGVNLIQILRNYRSELARVQAKGESLEPLSSLVNPKKWEITDQTVVNDTAVVGLDAANTFDHLLTASTCGGFYTKYRAMAPHNTLVVGVGAKPYLAFHYAIEGGAQPMLTDVAKAVASKIKSALPGWLTGGKSQSVEKTQPAPMISSEPMGCRFGIHDLRRIADKITLSPDKSLAVISDSLGRITLIDTRRGVCIRTWKGYREAEYSFVQVTEESALKRPKTRSSSNKHKPHKSALFLIIYAPKKGTIEIWVMQQGPKIATFTANKNSRLLYTSHGVMGLSGNGANNNKCNCQFASVFIDPDGGIKQVLIPFHFSLSERNSKRARDIHLVKKLKTFLKSEESMDVGLLMAQVNSTCVELKTNELRLQCIEMLMNLKLIDPPVLLEAANIILNQVESQESDPEPEVTHLITLCYNLVVLIKFYMYAVGEWPDLDLENGNVSLNKKQKPKLCDSVFAISSKEMDTLQRLLDFNCLKVKESERKVQFALEHKKGNLFNEYLNAFDLTTSEKIHLKKITPDRMYQISEVLFKSFILCDILDVTSFKTQIIASTIDTIDLIKLILSYWIQRPITVMIQLEAEMQNLSKIIYLVCQTTTLDNISPKYNDISPFWKEIRDNLAAVSINSLNALTAAVLCRSVAIKLEHDKEFNQSEEIDDKWENLSQDNCEWSILIGKLEDISLLNIILSSKPSINNPPLPKIMYDLEDISLRLIIEKGKGSVSELVARWLIEAGFNPENFIPSVEDGECDEHAIEEKEEASGGGDNLFEVSTQLGNLSAEIQLEESIKILKKQFPYSLENNVLLTNMAWEYILYWQKKIYHSNYLEAALKCIQIIENSQVKQGICLMIWNAHIKFLLENTCKLINKVSKLPKERLCRQDTGLSDTQLCDFINIVTNFLNTFLQTLQDYYKSTDFYIIKFENLWDQTQPAASITQLALQQNEINYDLLHLHYQLTLVLQMITQLNIKHSKPINNLFDSTSASLLFTDLTGKNSNIPIYNADTKLVASRQQFLMKVITSSIELVRVEGGHDGGIYASEHIKWMSKCLSLASVWGLDLSILKCHQVVRLFQNGYDGLASEILISISDVSTIGSALLAICGRRLLNLIVNSPDFKENIAELSPSLMSYLDTLSDSEEWCAPSTVAEIERLATQTLQCLSENSNERRLTNILLEACNGFDSS